MLNYHPKWSQTIQNEWIKKNSIETIGMEKWKKENERGMVRLVGGNSSILDWEALCDLFVYSLNWSDEDKEESSNETNNRLNMNCHEIKLEKVEKMNQIIESLSWSFDKVEKRWANARTRERSRPAEPERNQKKLQSQEQDKYKKEKERENKQLKEATYLSHNDNDNENKSYQVWFNAFIQSMIHSRRRKTKQKSTFRWKKEVQVSVECQITQQTSFIISEKLYNKLGTVIILIWSKWRVN